jgi:hypothetical protein
VADNPNANPLGANNQQPTYDNRFTVFELDPGVEDPVPVGTLMQIENYTWPTSPGDGQFTPAYVEPSAAASPGYRLVGVCIGGSSPGSAAQPGGACMVLTEGLTQILCDASTTAGDPLEQSAATAGAAKTESTVTAGTGIGVALEAVTISSGTALVPAYIHKV